MARAAAKRERIIPVPPEFGDAIERLRRATIDAKDFNVPWALFHDELASAPGFTMAGVEGKNPRLKQVVESAVQHVEPACTCGPMLMVHLGDFWHGLLDTSVGAVVAYYFEREDMGLLGFMSEARSHLVRFSVAELVSPGLSGPVTRGQA